VLSRPLADFLAKSSYTDEQCSPNKDAWSLFIDGSSTKDSSRTGLIIEGPKGRNKSMPQNSSLRSLTIRWNIRP